MGLIDGSDVVRIGGKTYTRSRALALGLIAVSKKGEVILTPAGIQVSNSAGEKAARADARAAHWRRYQGLPEEPETTSDGVLVRVKRPPKVLKPKNVMPDGSPVEDEETLAKIAEHTAAVEKAHLEALAKESNG